MDRMEQSLTLQGCTAIEDKLQDQVPWTINYCIRCGIRVWMITGALCLHPLIPPLPPSPRAPCLHPSCSSRALSILFTLTHPTGDKLETAENIGKSCNLISEDSAVVKIVDAANTNDCFTMLQTAQKVLHSERKVTLVVDSQSLGFLLVDHKALFAVCVATQYNTTIHCCRKSALLAIQ